MTLVRNLLPPLNGNNWSLGLVLCLLIMSCASSTTSSSRTKVIKPKTPVVTNDKPEAIPVDTVQWTFKSETDFPPITVDPKVAAYTLDRVEKEFYKIAILLPMRIKQDVPTIDANNKKFADFYAGIKLAAKGNNDLNASIKVYYTNREEIKLDAILDDMSNDLPDIILASYESPLIAKTAAFGRDNRIPVISPWKSSTTITEDNIFYLQLNPTIEHYYKRIIDHISYNFKIDEVRIIQRGAGQDRSKTRLMHMVQEKASALPLVTPIETMTVEMDSLMDSEASVFDTVLVEGVRAFILPHYSSRDESFIYSCLRKMYGEKAGRIFHIYTMPVALNSERVDINILKNLNIRTAEFRYPDLRNKEVNDFRNQFYQSYGWLPSEDAYYGYDLMSFITYGLINYGQYFHYFMAGEDLSLMQMRINISPFFKDNDKERPDFMANDHLYIVEYDRDHFEIIDIR